MRSSSYLTLVSVFALAAGCGGDDGGSAIADAAPDPIDGDVDASIDAAPDAPPDAPDPCAAGDSVCRQACLATDTDCTTTANDGKCVGNAGELCPNAMFPECNTMADVCGNGDCSVTESSDTCYADCGPSPWTWATLEDEVITLLNAARLAGITCPGSGTAVTRPALTVFAQTQPGSREAAWELAHHQQPAANGACNGRTLPQRLTEYGAVLPAALLLYQDAAATPQLAVNAWIANAGLCPLLLDANYTTISAGVAHDTTLRGIAIVLD